MASAIEQMVGAVVSWKHWDAASPSGALRHLAISDAWLSAYFTRQSTINSARHYVGPAALEIRVPRARPDIQDKELMHVKVKQQFSISGERFVYLLIGASGLEASACGVINQDGEVKHGCIRACASVA